MCLGVVVAILLLNVMAVYSVYRVGGGALLNKPCLWVVQECAGCSCDPSVHLSVPSICFVCVFVCRKLSPHLGV